MSFRLSEGFILTCRRFFLFQGISVAEQEKLDNLMIEMDGTENKCTTVIYIAYVIMVYKNKL